jgi:hypothetical protein
MGLLDAFSKSVKANDIDPRLIDMHPRHVGEHLRSMAKKDPVSAQRLTIKYLEIMYSKYLSEDPQDGSSFDIAVLDALKEVPRSIGISGAS